MYGRMARRVWDAAAVRSRLTATRPVARLTNTTSIRRHGLAKRPAVTDFLIAFFSVPTVALAAERGGGFDRGLFRGSPLS